MFIRLGFYLLMNLGLAYAVHYLDPSAQVSQWFFIFCALDGIYARARADQTHADNKATAKSEKLQ